MNVYDTKRMEEILAPLGYSSADTPVNADMIILNTCHIREKATEKVFSELGRLRDLKLKARSRGTNLILAVAGCVAQAEGQEIINRAPYVDLVFGPQTYHRLPSMVRKAISLQQKQPSGACLIDTDFPVESKFDHLPASNKSLKSAFLTIQEGCDKFCSFCVVPYTRGAETSRASKDVLSEANLLVKNGAVEITLLGQNVNAYHGEGYDKREWTLARLIRELADINGLERIRYITSHPKDMTDDLVSTHGDVPQLMPYLHLPIQSGSDRILEKMNRKHDSYFYRCLVEKLRRSRSDMAFSSDFIAGHPEEKDADFADTIKLINEVTFSQAYCFKYSSRPGTPASFLDQLPETVKSERLQTLQQLLSAQQLAFNKLSVNKTQSVLVERKGNKKNQLVGRGPYMQAVHFFGNDSLFGTFSDIEITEGHANSLSGQLAIPSNHINPPNFQYPQKRKEHSREFKA